MKNISVSASTHPQNKDITLLSVKGFIDTTTAPDFEKAFQSVLGEGRFKLVIDLKEVSYISSAGWGIFVGEIKRIRNQNGNLFFASMSPEVTDAYELLEFDTILKSFPDVEQAVQNGFGKQRAKKGPEAVKAAADPGKPGTEAVLEGPRIEFAEEKTRTDRGAWKTGWLGRILRPWRWF